MMYAAEFNQRSRSERTESPSILIPNLVVYSLLTRSNVTRIGPKKPRSVYHGYFSSKVALSGLHEEY